MNCRGCSGNRFGEVLDLGDMPLVNNLLMSPDQFSRPYPLHVVFCRDCSLAQLTTTPPPQDMFDEYLYFSSQSQTMVNHARRLVDRFVKSNDHVLEIASNDGYLLQHAMTRGAVVLGVEPARNIAEFAQHRGIPTVCKYFNAEVAKSIAATWGCADVVFANNVLAHVPDPHEIVEGIVILLSEHGLAHIEVPSVIRMIQQGAFDTIYHEHCSYFSLTSLTSIFAQHGLHIIDVEELDIHGGSYHVVIGRQKAGDAWHTHIEHERALGVDRDEFYAGFAKRVSCIRERVNHAIDRFQRVVAMGAAAKGIVLLNALGLTTDRIAWVADVSPYKQGRYVPGTLQPIVPPQRLLDEMPDAALLLPWNIKDEILLRNRQYRDQGGKFIVPIPSAEVV